MKPETCIAVFGDTHGRIRLMFQLCRLWQRAHHRHLHGILQCGDLGYFPDWTRLDRATGQFTEDDPEELGFANYFGLPEPLEPDPLLREWLEGQETSLDTVRVPAFWCHGNHEDFSELSYLAGGDPDPCPVDYFDKLVYLPSGSVNDLAGLRVAAVGGSYGEGGRGRRDRSGRHGMDDWQRIDASVCDQVRSAGRVDILLTHVASASGPGEIHRSGSRELKCLVEDCQPAYHFFAHHRGPIAPFTLGVCRSFWLKGVAFTRRGTGHGAPLNPGCMGILRWRDSSDHEFHIVDEDWMKEVTADAWREL